jgi:hypothetical protein
MKKVLWTLWTWKTAVAFLVGFLLPVAVAAGVPGDPASFPPPLEHYQDPEGADLLDILGSRVQVEPLNLVASLLFLGAIR